jgi:hypothetical protein
MLRCSALLLASACSALFALDSGPHQQRLQQRSNWEFKSKALAGIFDDLEKVSGVQLKRSPGVMAAQKSIILTMLAEGKTAADVLRALERSEKVRFIADGEFISAEMIDEFSQRPRRPISIDLNDYNLLAAVRDMPGSMLGFGVQTGAHAGFDLMSSVPESETLRTTSEDIITLLTEISGCENISAGSDSMIFAEASPAEEDIMRKALAERSATGNQALAWRVTFGLAAAEQGFPTGVVSGSAAAAVRKLMHDAVVTDVVGLNGQRVHAGAYRERSVIGDAVIVSNNLDPVIQTITTGRSFDVRAAKGIDSIILDYSISWADAGAEDRVAVVRQPRHEKAQLVETPSQSPAQNGQRTATDPGAKQASVDSGRELKMSLPEVWVWGPRGIAHLRPGQALIFAAERGNERAVAVVESMTTDAESAVIDLQADKQPVALVLEQIASRLHVGLVVDATAAEKLQVPASIDLHDASLRDISMVLSGLGLEISYQLGWIQVGMSMPKERLLTKSYPAHSLTFGKTNYPGIDLAIPEPGGLGSRTLSPIEAETAPETNEVIDILRKTVAPESWDAPGVSINEDMVSIVVTQSAGVHALIAAKLAELERSYGRQLICRVYAVTVDDNTPPILAQPAWTAMLAQCHAPVAAFVLLNGTQNNHFCGTQRSYVADGDNVQEGIDPIISVLSQGLSVDTTPQITVDGVLANMRLTQSTSDMSVFDTMKDDQGNHLLELENPRVERLSARETRLIPYGGAALYRIGGRAYAVSFEKVEQ